MMRPSNKAAQSHHDGADEDELHDRILTAQMQASKNSILPPHGFLGRWSDTNGNAIVVHAIDACGLMLMATLSRPPRHNIYLRFRLADAGTVWLCGNATLAATLGPTGSLPWELYWAFPDGKCSVWVREQAVKGNGVSSQDGESAVPVKGETGIASTQDAEGLTPSALET